MTALPYRRDEYFIAEGGNGDAWIWIYDNQATTWWTPSYSHVSFTRDGMERVLGEGQLRPATADEIEEIDREVFS